MMVLMLRKSKQISLKEQENQGRQLFSSSERAKIVVYNDALNGHLYRDDMIGGWHQNS
jgi:hypothetical protein